MYIECIMNILQNIKKKALKILHAMCLYSVFNSRGRIDHLHKVIGAHVGKVRLLCPHNI